MKMIIRDTDDFHLDRALRKMIEERVTEHGACLLYEDTFKRSIHVRLRGGGMARASIMRVAWALAHPEDHLLPGDIVEHTCEETGEPGTHGCCIKGEHLVKGTFASRTAHNNKKAQANRLREAA